MRVDSLGTSAGLSSFRALGVKDLGVLLALDDRILKPENLFKSSLFEPQAQGWIYIWAKWAEGQGPHSRRKFNILKDNWGRWKQHSRTLRGSFMARRKPRVLTLEQS
ncbi:hypothetical protein TNCV_2765771 [Trichonephila clavipes]|nr:hypothetical protein TNCV_2765771 [Trichonephila clavipes]